MAMAHVRAHGKRSTGLESRLPRGNGQARSLRKSGLIDSRYAPFHLKIRRSGIHGFGVFALETIPRGRNVIEYTGEHISRVEARRRFLRAWHSRDKRIYLAWLNPYWLIDGGYGGSGAELINHCCAPNLQIKRTPNRIFFRSLRPIRRGEELTIDYNFPKSDAQVPCCCGAAACRGTINRK